MLKRNMRQELITEDELLVELRKQGIDDLRKVKAAHMEQDGRISVIQVDTTAQDRQGRTTCILKTVKIIRIKEQAGRVAPRLPTLKKTAFLCGLQRSECETLPSGVAA